MKIKRFLLFSLILTLFICVVSPIQIMAEDNVTVIVNGEVIEFDVEPIIIEGRTMVPFRKIFEVLGAEVNYKEVKGFGDSVTQLVDADCGYLSIGLMIGSKEMSITQDDGFGTESLLLDVAPLIVNGRTLVPLRAVSEGLGADVDWNGETSTVYITTEYNIENIETNKNFDNKHIITSYNKEEYFDFRIENDLLEITGVTNNPEIKYLLIRLDNGVIEKNENNYFTETIEIRQGKEFSCEIDLSKYYKDEICDIKIYSGTQEYGSFNGYIYDVLNIEKKNNDYFFVKPLVIDNNYDVFSDNTNPMGYLKSSEFPELIALSNEICRDAENDYDKILKIHDWVADNIYYDYDAYYSSLSNTFFEPEDVYKNKRTVCEGYAELVRELVQIQGIPCREVSGYALGISANVKSWTSETAAITDSNHAWNQAFVDNRWVNIDVTWDSGNEYRNGQYIYKGIKNHRYFDISDEFLAYNHKNLYIDLR